MLGKWGKEGGGIVATKLRDSSSISKGTLYTIVNYSHLSPPIGSWLGMACSTSTAVVDAGDSSSSAGVVGSASAVALAVMIAMVLVVVSTNDEAR